MNSDFEAVKFSIVVQIIKLLILHLHAITPSHITASASPSHITQDSLPQLLRLRIAVNPEQLLDRYNGHCVGPTVKCG